MHLITPWLEARCDRGASEHERAGAIYDDWREFAHARREEPGSPGDFAIAMEARGFECDQLPGERHRIRWGLRLKRPEKRHA